MFHRQTLPVTVIVLVLLVSYSQAWVITLFEHNDHRGLSIDVHVEGNNCDNMPHSWNDHTSSINSHGRCFLLYENVNCGGIEVKISMPTNIGAYGCPRHNELGCCFKKPFWKYHFIPFDFNDKLSSLRLC